MNHAHSASRIARRPHWLRSLEARLFSLAGGRSTGRRSLTRRARGGFEQVEYRRMMAPLGPDIINGVVLVDITGNGFSPDDIPQAGVTVQLFQDNGDTVFNPALDPLVGAQITNLAGEYVFGPLANGRYYVRELVPAGFTQTAGPPFYTAVINGSGFPPGASDIVIDTFELPAAASNSIINLNSPDPTLLEQVAGGVLGLERDVLVNVNGAPVPISAAFSLGGGEFEFITSFSPGTTARLQYDGLDADNPGPPASLVNSNGLLVDLTSGGANTELRLDFLSIDGGSGTTLGIIIRLQSGAGETATLAADIPQDANPSSFFASFASFATTAGFSFAAVTSIEVDFNPTAVERVEFRLDQITATRQNPGGDFNFANQPQVSSLSGFVYADVNNNGIIDPGELGIGNVTVTLTGTDFLGNPVNRVTATAANGFYIFQGLLAGNYTIVETQPADWVDGKDTIGTPGGSAGNDVLFGIALPGGFDGVQNNFGELSLSGDVINKGLFITGGTQLGNLPAVEPPIMYPIGPQQIVQGETITFAARTIDPQNEGLTWALGPNPPAGASINPANGQFSFTTNAPAGTVFQVTIVVTDQGGRQDSETFNITVVQSQNIAPLLQTIPDQFVLEGTTLSAVAQAIEFNLGDTVTYSLGPGAPAGTTIDPVTGLIQVPVVDNLPAPLFVNVIATDDGTPSLSSMRTFKVTILNVAPIAAIAGPATGLRGDDLTFTFSATDQSPIDQANPFTYRIDWDGNGTIDQIVVGPGSGVNVTHQFFTSGNINVRATATDKDGGQSGFVSRTVVISDAALMPNGDLRWGGTDGADDAAFITSAAGTVNIIQTRQNGVAVNKSMTISGVTGRVIVSGFGGADTLDARAITDLQLLMNGGGADDVLIGGSLDDELRGGTGNDRLIGGIMAQSGNDTMLGEEGVDVLFGHSGSDSLNGGSGGDLLVADTLLFANIPAATQAIQAEWTSARTYAERVANISGTGVGPNANGGTVLTPNGTVDTDGTVDNLLGGTEQDWFLFTLFQDLIGAPVEAGETETDVDP